MARRSLKPWPNTLGTVMRKLGWSGMELSRRTEGREHEVSPASVSRIIRGDLVPTIPVAKVIADTLGMTIEQAFLRGDEEPASQDHEELARLLFDAMKQLGPFARKHPRGEDGIRDVRAVLSRIDVVLTAIGISTPQREWPAIAS